MHLKQRPAQYSVVTMRLFRELHTSDDDPVRRNDRDEPSPTKDEGDLFIHRPSPRKIRVLLDVENLPDDKTVPTQLFEALLRSERVFQLEVDVSTIGSTDGHATTRAGSLSIRDSTVDAGSFSYPGPQYTWSIGDENPHADGSTTLSSYGFANPHRQIREAANTYRYLKRQERSDYRLKDVVKLAILAEVARSSGFDLIVSEAPATACRLLPVHGRALVVSRREAVSILAHYLRRQHRFLVDPRCNAIYSRHVFYERAVNTIVPALRNWTACVNAASGGPHSTLALKVYAGYQSSVRRLARALETRDDLIASLGSYPTEPVQEDCVDDLDHLLLLLCGGTDALARALHLALGLKPRESRNAKLHADWFNHQIVERYQGISVESAPLEELAHLHKSLKVVFALRNSIHNLRITPAPIASAFFSTFGGNDTTLAVHISPDIAETVEKIGSDIAEEWGFVSMPIVGTYVDLWSIVEKSVNTVLRFLNTLSGIVLRNPLDDACGALLSGTMPFQDIPESLPWAGYDDHLPLLVGIPKASTLTCAHR